MKNILRKIKKFILENKVNLLLGLISLVAFIIGGFALNWLISFIIVAAIDILLFIVPMIIRKIKRRKKVSKETINNPKPKKEKKVKKKSKWKWLKILLIIFFIGCILVLAAVSVFFFFIVKNAPEFDPNELYQKESSILYDSQGNIIRKLGAQNREIINYEDLPEVLINAIVATEDSRFFQHNGFDLPRFVKATIGQLTNGSTAGGASTLTMQVVKNTYTDASQDSGIKGIIRKFTDIYMAMFKLEKKYTKEEILEFYANSLWFGHDGNLNYTGIYGVEQASQFFFNKSVTELTLAESSLLVGMYQNPVLYNPYKNPEGCRNRQKIVLKLMVHHGYITEDEMNAILDIKIESLLADHEEQKASNENQAAIDYIIDTVEKATGKDPSYTPMQIYTTIDPEVQVVLNKLEAGELFKFYDEYDQEGTAITSVEDGSIVALSGGRNYYAKGLNRATNISRQPGSTAKPLFDYGPYLEYLNGSTADYFFDDEYSYSNGTPIADADRKYQGMITMRESLVGSRNITALQAFQKVYNEDPDLISDFVHSFGIDYGTHLYESASIGGFDGVSPLEMSAAYAVFARGGYYIEPYIFTKVIFEDGTTYEHKYTKEKIISEETSYMITSMLIDAVIDGWSGNINVRGTQIAGKTGTTDIDDKALQDAGIPLGAIRDSWSVTYSPEYSIALWYGYDTTTKEHYMTTNTGWNARSKIMASLSKNIYSINKTFKKPSGVIEIEVEKYSYPLQLPSEYTPEDMRITELFREGTEPTEVSTRYSKLATPSNGSYSSNGNTVTIKWDNIPLPNAIDTTYLQDYFNENYGKFASKYYENRVTTNTKTFGNLGYQVYLEGPDGTITNLGWVENTTYTQTLELGKDYTFIIKSSYQLFKDNESDGLKIKVKLESNTSSDDNEVDTQEPEDIPTIDNTTDSPDNIDTGLN